MRQPSFQTVRCAQCGQTLFVLPKNPYPPLESEVKARKKVGRPKAESPAIVAQSRPADSEQGDTPQQSTSAAKTGTREAMEITVFLANSPVAKVPTAKKERRALFGRKTPRGVLDRSALPRRAILTPFRLVMLGLATVMFTTGYFWWHSRRVDQAEQDLKFHGEQGLALLKEHDFRGAAADLEKATHALDILGRDDHRARTIRQAHREVVAVGNLATVSFFEILQQANDALARRDRLWDERFSTLYGQKWIVIETTVKRTVVADLSDDKSHELLVFELPITVGGSGVVIQAAKPAVEHVLAADQESKEAIIGARLESCRHSSNDNNWVITLKADSVFLWSGWETLQAIEFDAGEGQAGAATSAILEKQSQFLGVER